MSDVTVERRCESRRRGLLRGNIVFGGGFSSLDCTVRDVSSKGARVTFSGPPLIPPVFELRLMDRGERRAAHKVWLRGSQMGLAYD